MSLGRSAIPLPVLRYSSGAAAPSGAALYFKPPHEDTMLLGQGGPSYALPAATPAYLEPAHEDTMLLGKGGPTFLEPET